MSSSTHTQDPRRSGSSQAGPGQHGALSAHTPLEVTGLATTFHRNAGSVLAVRGVDIELAPGETLVLLGESGSGKSVTIRSILRLYGTSAQHAGTVRLGDLDLLQLGPSALRAVRGRTISMVPQDPNGSLDPLRKVGRQIEQVLVLHGTVPDRKAAKTRALELLGLVGIPSPARVAASYPHELSGGMRQRVAIAIAIACDPVVLLADEPTTALDVTVQSQILDLFTALQDRLGTALLLVTHDVSVAADIADRVAVMYAGSIVEQGPAREVLDNPRHPYTQALLDAIPHPTSERGQLKAIPGSPPVAGAHFTGCAFVDRCPLAQDTCRTDPPALLQVAPAHQAACPVANPKEAA
ncbi:ABC transporter ATP-binding protein [Kineococcus sp. SYSU DK003]|uniref:ABC transporter ATP-binding protein n=1 Tax=Kineococcus sp. SYSU DK003 TaxID=3383124 RepID=UPI003D7D50D0